MAAIGWTLLIYSTLSAVRAPIEFLRERGLLQISVAAVFLLTAATIAFILGRTRPTRNGIAVLVVFSLVYVAGFLRLERAEERLHLIEYGVLAGLVYVALLERRRRRLGQESGSFPEDWRPGVAAVLVASAIGWGDEFIQGILPTRVYDLRDVALNFAASALAVTAMVAWRRTRRPSR